MAKQNNAQNSNLEEKILKELQKNCRLNLDEIGKKCGCSRYKVSRVMKKLEENNTIVGYSAIINPTKIKLKYFIYESLRRFIFSIKKWFYVYESLHRFIFSIKKWFYVYES